MTTKKNVGVTRAKADRLIADFLERVQELNQNPDYLYRVTKVAVFGSYLSEKEKLGDLDIAVELDAKCEDKEQHWKLHDAQCRLAPDHIKRSMISAIYWPRTRCAQMLKARSTAISLHEYSELAHLIEYAAEKKMPMPSLSVFPVIAAASGGGEQA